MRIPLPEPSRMMARRVIAMRKVRISGVRESRWRRPVRMPDDGRFCVDDRLVVVLTVVNRRPLLVVLVLFLWLGSCRQE